MTNNYNLIDEPFISYFNKDGSTGKAGILDIFRNADKISRIGGDNQIQELPLMRLLLAIMYRALDNVQTSTEWINTWEAGLPMDKIESYLERYRDRFDLLHAETPFYQIRGAVYTKADKEESNLELLIDHQALGNGSGRFLFSSYKPTGYSKLPFDVAARKLVELQAYNTASKKSTLVGDTRKKKYGYAQVGWLGNFSAVMVLGNTLKQTLLLNFVPYDEWPTTISYTQDRPVWEREPQTAEAESVWGDMDESRSPSGPADLYTHQISRVELKNTDSMITSTVVGIGDRIFKHNFHHIEPMAAWRNVTREDKTKAYFPIAITSNDSWKAVNTLLGEVSKQNGITLVPGVYKWFDTIYETVEDEVGEFVSSVVFTSEYGAQSAIINTQTVSTLKLPRDAVSGINHKSHTLLCMINAIKASEEMGGTYKVLLADLFIAEGKKQSIDKGVTPYKLANPKMEEFYYDLSQKYSEWILSLTNDNAEEKFNEWLNFLERFTRSYGNKAVEGASRQALAGHQSGTNKPTDAKKGEDKKFMSTYVASAKFENVLKKKFAKIKKERITNGK